MNYLKNLKEQFTFDQLLLIFTCFSFTFPFYILGPILLIEFIYLLVSKKAIIALKQTQQIKFLYLFVLISLSISIIHKNILIFLQILPILCCHRQKDIHPDPWSLQIHHPMFL